MSKLIKKLMYILFAAIAITALLLPSPGMVNHTASLESTQQTAPVLAWDFRDPGGAEGFFTTNGYTWAG